MFGFVRKVSDELVGVRVTSQTNGIDRGIGGRIILKCVVNMYMVCEFVD
jgi:hypothetical protein